MEPVRALVLGGVAWNTMVYLDSFPDPEPHTAFAHGYHETVGSSGAGKALNLTALGADVLLWGMVGDDELGQKVIGYFAAAGVDFRTAPDPTGTVRHINLMDRSGERISIFANGGAQELTVEPEVIVPWLGDVDLCTVTITDPCKRFLPVLRDAGIEYWCDLHDYDGENPFHREYIDGADHLQITSNELPDWQGWMEAQIENGTKTVTCTHGAAGASALTAAEGWVHVDAEPVPVEEVVDTNGAGDAFFAGFALARHAGADLETATRAGTRSGAAAVRSSELAPIRPRGASR